MDGVLEQYCTLRASIVGLEKFIAMKTKESIGGRAGTRTPDLMRVKNVRGFHDLYVVICFLLVS